MSCNHEAIYKSADNFYCGVCERGLGSAFYQVGIEHKLVGELLTAIESAELDIGGSRPADEIIKDLGAQWARADRFFVVKV